MEKNHVNVQGTEDYKEGNTSLAESVGKEQDSIKKDRAAAFAKNVAKASIEEGVPVMMKVFGGMLQAALGIMALTIRVIFGRHD